MRIGALSQKTGVSVRLLRYYEEQGLLKPSRRPSGYREYVETDVETVRGIRTLLAAGLSTATIAELLPCMVASGHGLALACHELLPGLHKERDRLTQALDELTAAREVLDSIITATVPADAGDPPACHAPGAAPLPGAVEPSAVR
jgi:DNA-binding transcriptional MerR regulator